MYLLNRLRYYYLTFLPVLFFSCTNAQTAKDASQVNFKKHTISSTFIAEGAAAGDINNDGKTDIVAGNYWFEAPAWKPHLLHADTLNPVPGYSTSFINFCFDVNNDSWPDLIKFDQPGGACIWYENPKRKDVLWQPRIILDAAGIESPACVDVDLDGRMDLICNDTVTKNVIWLKPPSGQHDTTWKRFVISSDKQRGTNRYTHGLGWGDVNQDGLNDVIIKSGWWQSPVSVKDKDWKFHPADLGEDCANMFVYDLDGDGDQDVISSSAHNYGIWWHEQQRDETGNITWITHAISKLFSQSHALAFEDINSDGHPDLVTGKRYLAHHDGHDPGSYEPAVLYWFEYIAGKNPQWVPHEIDNNSGIGNVFVAKDINADSLIDIVISNKKGVFFFEQVK